MRAFVLDSFDAAPALRDDLPVPEVADDQVLVRVLASSANPADNFVASGMLKAFAEYEFPVVLGRDYAGVVERVGAAVTHFTPGDEVYGYVPHANPTAHDGAWAELIAVGQDAAIARRPAKVSAAEAAAAPVAALTALAAYDAAGLGEGDTALVVGASGGVGGFAVQLLAHARVQVIAPALPEDGDYLRGLGVTELIERGGDVAADVRERHPGGVDALFDLVSYSPDALGAYTPALREGGAIVSSVGAAGEGPSRHNVGATPTRESVERLAGLLDGGTLVVRIQATYPLERAGEALADLAARHTQGKLGISLA